MQWISGSTVFGSKNIIKIGLIILPIMYVPILKYRKVVKWGNIILLCIEIKTVVKVEVHMYKLTAQNNTNNVQSYWMIMTQWDVGDKYISYYCTCDLFYWWFEDLHCKLQTKRNKTSKKSNCYELDSILLSCVTTDLLR